MLLFCFIQGKDLLSRSFFILYISIYMKIKNIVFYETYTFIFYRQILSRKHKITKKHLRKLTHFPIGYALY